jgi:Tfp pilus assembly protein PilF
LSFSAAVTVALCLFSAQQSVNVVGELTTINGEPTGTYTVEIASISTHLPVDRTVSSSSGKFEFHNLPTGNYTIFVRTESGDVVGFQDIASAMGMNQVSIQIVEAKRSKPISGTVSAASLQHRPPKKAAQEMNLAIRASEAGDSAGAERHLVSALRLDPDFSEAHTNLGAEYARSGRLQQAYSEFESALKLGPKGAIQYCNIAVVALALNRIDEAEGEVRQALSVDSRSSQSNFLLGKILALQGHQEEAVRRLKLAAADIPSANELLTKLQKSH